MTLPSLAQHVISTKYRDVAGKRIGVLGLARSGIAVLEFLSVRGAQLIALDSKPLNELSPEARQAVNLAVEVICPCTTPDQLPQALDMLVVAPGVPTDSPLILAAREHGVEVIGEVELAYRFADVPFIAVTGTNGKGTTCTAIGAMLEAAQIPHVVAGNIGIALISQMEKSSELKVIVAEISSYQLETTVHFHPYISILLNITEDHMERYHTFEPYIAAKQLIFQNQTDSDRAILCTDDPLTAEVAKHLTVPQLHVSLNDQSAAAHLTADGMLQMQLPESNEIITLAKRSELPLQGLHHVTNFLVASLAAGLCGADAPAMHKALLSYATAPHLMAFVTEVQGVRYIDDSKATNPASALADLQGINGPLIVIAGGKEKDTDFVEFGQVLAQRARRIFLMGECAPRIEEAVARPGLCRRVGSMEEAVSLAVQGARPGDTVILCPGCSSLDMFASYATRGDEFVEAVRKLTAQST